MGTVGLLLPIVALMLIAFYVLKGKVTTFLEHSYMLQAESIKKSDRRDIASVTLRASRCCRRGGAGRRCREGIGLPPRTIRRGPFAPAGRSIG